MKTDFRVSIFANLQSCNSKEVGFDEVVRLVKHDTIVGQKTAAYRQMAHVISREEANKRVKKERMEAFSVGVIFDSSGKQPENVVRFTGLAMCDIDKIDNVQLTIDNYLPDEDKLAYVKQLIINDPHTLLCYTTISKNGLRVIYRYQRESMVNCQSSIVNNEIQVQLDGVPWRAAFQAGNDYYRQLTGCDYDKACSDYGRLSGLAHDPEVYYNPDAEPFVITDEMILAANFADGTQEGRPYKEQPAGSQTATADEAWPRVEKMLCKRDLKYELHHRHDFILHASYLFNRFGVPDESLRSWAETHWSDFDTRERDSIIRHCYKNEGEHGTWRLSTSHRKKSHENSMITIAEIRDWLSAHVELAYNVVTDQTMLRNIDNGQLTIDNYHPDENHPISSPPQLGGVPKSTGATYQDSPPKLGGVPSAGGGGSMLHPQWQIVDDRILASLRSQMAVDTDKRVLKSDVYDVIKSDFAPLVHPVRDYINALPPWDGRDRVGELTTHIHVEALLPEQDQDEAQQDLAWAFHKWMGATVMTWMDDNVSNHEVFTIIGRQGIYKTTLFRYLLPPELRSYFWENAHNTFSSKDDHLALAENCLVDIEEVEATTQHELSELKSLITSDTVKERRPYARFRDAKHRLASLCATGNQQRFLTDETGNRRWLCFKVSHIDDPRSWGIDYQQLYAQIREELKDGFRYWFDYEDEQRVERLNKPFRVESDEEQLIRMRLRPPHEGENVKLMNAAMVCQLLNGGHVGYPLSSRKVSVAMKRLGFESVHTRQGNLFKVFEIPYDQVQAHLSAAAYDATHEPPHEPESPTQTKLPF